MEIPLIKPNLSMAEAKAVSDTIVSGWVSQGRKVEEFENLVAEYTGASYAVAFCNGTAALHAILLALGIRKGAEVIVPSFTFFSTASSVVHAGATPVFADIDPRSFTMDPEDVAGRCVSLPCYATMTPEEIDYLANSVEESLEQISNPVSVTPFLQGKGED